MAKYQQYDEYKDVQNEWVSSVPSDWKVVPLKALCLNPVKDGPHETPIFIDEGIPFLSVDGIQNNQLVFEGCRYISEQDHKKYSRKCAPAKGDVLLGKAASVGKVAYVDTDIDFNVWSPLAVITPKTTSLSKYIFYAFQSTMLQAQCEVYSNSNTQKNLGMNTIDNLHLPFPSYKEAEKIANFLDHETAQIDTLIEKQQTLIKLLKEKRQAVISHAVTKGLNPDAPMKDSGVEWLGDVPEHWEVTKFSHCAQIRNGLVDPKSSDFKNLVLYAPNHIEKGTGKIVYKETAEEQGADSSKYLCYKGEVIYSKIRPALAKVAICEEEAALCSADMYPINAVNGLDNQFLYFFMLSDNFTKAAILDSDRVAMPKINRESLSDYRLPVPPSIEQMEICRFIADQNTKLEELESKATKAIQLMQERRTALISAAVTGKIDVRDWVAHDSDAV